jgi:ELWxxDGT repeat protein
MPLRSASVWRMPGLRLCATTARRRSRSAPPESRRGWCETSSPVCRRPCLRTCVWALVPPSSTGSPTSRPAIRTAWSSGAATEPARGPSSSRTWCRALGLRARNPSWRHARSSSSWRVPGHGDEVWRTDGTAEGTFLLADINPGIQGSSVAPGGPWRCVLFKACAPRRLRVVGSDGTPEGSPPEGRSGGLATGSLGQLRGRGQPRLLRGG